MATTRYAAEDVEIGGIMIKRGTPVVVVLAGANRDPETFENAADDDEVLRPEGWTRQTHGKKGDPNYEVVFPGNKVNRLDITILKYVNNIITCLHLV